MKTFSYNKEVKNAITQFLDVFNDIPIQRTSENVTVRARAVLGSRARVIKQLENPEKAGITLPIIAVTLTDFSRDPSRVANLNNYMLDIPDITLMADGEFEQYYNQFTPNPVTLSFKVDILTKYQEDLQQIISNFVAFFNPSIYVVTPHPKIQNATIKHKVVWDGSVAIDLQTDNPGASPIQYSANATFKYETWMFPGSGYKAEPSIGLIKRINFYPEMCGEDSDGVFTLSNFYAVPQPSSFTEFKSAILSGLIKLPYFDRLPMFAIPVQFADGTSSMAFSGYYQDVSAMITGLTINDSVLTSASALTYLVTQNGNMLVFGEGDILNVTSENISLSTLIYDLENYGSPQ